MGMNQCFEKYGIYKIISISVCVSVYGGYAEVRKGYANLVEQFSFVFIYLGSKKRLK